MKHMKPYDLNESPQKAKHEPTPYNLNYRDMNKKKKVCKHINKERIDWGTDICRDCKKSIK